MSFNLSYNYRIKCKGGWLLYGDINYTNLKQTPANINQNPIMIVDPHHSWEYSDANLLEIGGFEHCYPEDVYAEIEKRLTREILKLLK
jgi:hypothetical protein